MESPQREYSTAAISASIGARFNANGKFRDGETVVMDGEKGRLVFLRETMKN